MPRAAASQRAHTYVPDAGQGEAIVDFVRVLDQAGFKAPGGRPALVDAQGHRLELPDDIFAVLRQVAEALAAGMGVSVVPLHARLTTQQAADYLGISRPTMVRILERGEIPMERPGRHRYVRLEDLIAFQEQAQEQRREALDAMVAEAEDGNMYDRLDRPAPPMR
ncbi:MAG TPA: helix-turn-helix domain-containing protein [Actinomycetota bacterium]|nr:helix-turn-helix domain-containing protein [Actinomycetota bacterium]